MNALGLGYSETKIKPYLKMAVQRIQIANNKKTTSVKHQKREVANLLGEQKDEKARIKVEHIIRDDFVIEAYEILELLCELMHERIRLITNCKECPADLKETVCSLIWAAGNCEISELQEVKKHLIRKFGPEFGKDAEENTNFCVNARLFNKLSYKPASRMLVNGYMIEIAKVYKVAWDLPVELEGELVDDEFQPFSTPSGYSINMAPGSGLTAAYSQAPARPSPPATQAARALSPEEQEEYDQFHKHQAKGTGAVSVPPSSPAVQPVYSPVAGPPPRFDSKGASSFSAATDPVQGAHPAQAPPAAVVTKPSAQSFAQATAPPPATAATVAATGSALDTLPPPAPIAPVQTAHASAQKKDNDDSSDHEGEYSPPPFAPGHTPPPTPPPAVVAPTAPVDPMEAMLARLAALK
eukprot:gene14244-16374_t